MGSPFTKHDCQLQRRVYKAFENGPDANSIASIRDEAVARHDTASTFIVAFSKILQGHNFRCSNSQWLPFNECLKGQNVAKEKKYWKSHLEHLAFISMQWSPDVVSDYHWTAEIMKRDQLNLLYKCAQRYPRFVQDFLPQINLVWWLHYTSDLPIINNWTSEPNRTFRNIDLQSVLDLSTLGTTTIRGIEIDTDSAAHRFGRHICTWTESRDGHVSMPDRPIDLKALKSEYWNMYALCTDKYGLLKQRDRAQWDEKRPLPAAVSQELYRYPFGDRVIRPTIVRSDRTDIEGTATGGSEGGLGPTSDSDPSTLAAGGVSDNSVSSEQSTTFSESADCSLLDTTPGKTPEVSRNCEASLEGEAQGRHYNLRPEDCLCSVCQNHRPFLDKIHSEYLRSDPDYLRRLRKKWLSEARWASRGETRSSFKNDSSDPDIWTLDESSLETLANESSVLDKPIVVLEAGHDSTAHSVDSFQSAIRDNHYENEVGSFLTLFSNNEQPTARSFLRGQFQVQDPQFMKFSRFTVLQRASTRAFNSLVAGINDSDHCCKDPLHTSFLISGLSSVCVETTGAANGPHISALGGSWFRSLVGKRLYALAKVLDLHSMQGDRSVTSIQERMLSQIDEVQLVLLEPNEVLILPPGIAFLHFAVDPSATLEGHFWDDRDVDRYIEAAEMAKQLTAFAGDIPPCVPQHALDGYQSIVRGSLSKSGSCQPPIDQSSEQLSMRWRSCPAPVTSGLNDASIGVSLASGSFNPSSAVETESGTRRETGEHEVIRAKRVCIR